MEDQLILTSEEFVYKFGTDARIASYVRSSKIDSRIKKSLIKIAKTQYENVEVVKIGRVNYYKLSGMFDEELPISDKRGNKNWLPYVRNLDLIILSYLEKGIFDKEGNTLNRWLLQFGLINKEQYCLIKSRYNNKKRFEIIGKIMSKRPELFETDFQANEVLDDYIDFINELRRKLEDCFDRMKKAKIIDYSMKRKAFVYYPDGKQKYIYLPYDIIRGYDRKRLELIEKYNLQSEKGDIYNWKITHLRYDKDVVAYHQELQEYMATEMKDSEGKHVKVKYIFQSYELFVKPELFIPPQILI